MTEGGVVDNLRDNLLYLDDAYLTSFVATVTNVIDSLVQLDRTAFYPTGGGQQHDTGYLDGRRVIEVFTDTDGVWHRLDLSAEPLSVGMEVKGVIDWERRHQNMRTHTAMHLLCGIIWNQYAVRVTGGNMEPLSGRMDFNFDPVPLDFRSRIEHTLHEEIELDRPVIVSYLERGSVALDEELVRTATALVPDGTPHVRMVELVGLDKQADGGTHVRSTKEIGVVTITKVENKGKNNKRIRIAVHDRQEGND